MTFDTDTPSDTCYYGYKTGGKCQLGFPGCACADDYNMAHPGSCQVWAGIDSSYQGSLVCNCGGDDKLKQRYLLKTQEDVNTWYHNAEAKT